ncbi:MAG: Hpt domain-containing protein, partial [Gammaproteobacteria bacterium]
MMHEAVDYNALSWVRQELDVTLGQAHAMLVEYSGNEESTELLHGYAELLHQMRGPLQIAELDGADLLVAEMEAVVAGMPCNGEKARHESALEILLQSMQILPAYLSRLQSSEDDEPELVLPQVNLLRSVHGGRDDDATDTVTQRYIALPAGVFLGREAGSAAEIAARAHSARVRFQSALLAWYRGGGGTNGTAALVDVLGQLQDDAGSESEARLWWVGAGVAEALTAGLLDDSREIKQLFGQLDRQIKRLVESGDVDFGDAQTQVLLNDLLSCISGVEANEGRLAVILSACDPDGMNLDQDAGTGPEIQPGSKAALPLDGTMDPGVAINNGDAGGSMADADPAWQGDSKSAVSSPVADNQFQEILKGISLSKEAIDEYLNVPSADGPLSSVSVVLDGVSNDLVSAGLDRESYVIASVKEFVCNEILESTKSPDDVQLRHLADAICSVEFYLECLRDGRIFGNRIIESAEAHVATLGYPVPRQPAESTEQTGAAAESASTGPEQDETGKASDASGAVSEMQIVDPDADREILEIFFDESDAGLNTLRQLVSELETGNVSGELLEDISRVFHTLKGNSRMLGAQALGEFAYVLENLVNSALSGCASVDSEFTGLLEQACEAASQLVEQVKDAACKPGMDIDALASEAVRMSHAVAGGIGADSGAVDAEEVTACIDSESVSTGVDEELPVLAADADPEIVEIFIDEAGEEVARLAEIIPAWIGAPEQPDILAEIRRILHTLKGSGRMAGALFMGEFAWAMEDLFNRVIAGSVRPDDAFYSLVEKLPSVLKQLTDQITDGTEPGENPRALMTDAAELCNGAGDTSIATASDLNDVVESDTGTGYVTETPDPDNSLLQIYAREC